MLNKIRKFLCKIFLKFSKKGVFYISGPELLPPPLSAEEEFEIIERMQTDPSASSKLIEHNLRLVVYIAKKFENTGVGIEDLTSIGTIGLIKAIKTYKADKNIKLATYASRCIENEILMFVRRSSNRIKEVSIDEPLNTDWDGNELLLSDVLGTEEDEIRKMLIKLYQDTDGDNWTNNENWCSDKPINEWYGIVLLEDRGEFIIHLTNNNLDGTIDLSNFMPLTSLYCQENNIKSIDFPFGV